MTTPATPAPAAAPANAAPSNAAPAADPSKQTPAPAPAADPAKPAEPQPAADPAAAKPGAKTEPPKPAEYVEVKKDDLKLPDGSLLDPKTLDEVLSFSKEKKLSKEETQGLLERESKLLSSYVDGEKAKLTQIQTSWTEEARTDKEIGGDKFAENVECANRVFKHFGSEGLMKILDVTKAGNHPEFIRVFNRIGRALNVMDDKFVVADGQASGKPKDAASLLYGQTSPDKENK